MRLGAASGVFFAFGLAACSLIYGPSDAEFSSGRADGGHLPDGAPVSTSSSASSSGEGGVPSSDAGHEAGAAPFTCPPTALLCDDFESPATNPFPETTGAITIASPGEDSAHSLAATLKKGSSPYVSATFNPTTAAVTFDFWFKLDSAAPDPDDQFRLASVLWGNGCDWQLSSTVHLGADGLYFDLSTYDQNVKSSCGPVDYTGLNPPIPASKIADGNWHHVTLATDARTTTVTVTATIDDGAPTTLSLTLKTRTDLPTSVNVAVGVPCVQTNAGCFDWSGADWRVLFDNTTLVVP